MYKSAKQLGILPEERKALVAFVKAPSMGRVIQLDGGAHFYDQSYVEPEFGEAEANECGTAGCIAGYVYWHVRKVQRKRSIRGSRDADSYINRATWNVVMLQQLYGRSEGNTKLAHAKKVVDRMLMTGEVRW